MKKGSAVDAAIIAAKKVQPDLWERTEQVAHIIDPAAFAEWTLVAGSADVFRLHKARQRYQQAIAMSKAQEALKCLGVNVDADWFAILQEIAKESR